MIAVDTSDKEITDVYAVANRLVNTTLSFNFWENTRQDEDVHYYLKVLLYKCGICYHNKVFNYKKREV